MSYTQTKTIRVNYIDHDYYIDGNGNVVSKEIERSKDVDINVQVNTDPFDNSAARCGNQIGVLASSITGFKAAEIAVKRENEQAIVGSVVGGFTALIDQNLSLQNAGVEADMHALAGELLQQCKELGYRHEVMNKDFNRIKARYTSLFETINKELNNRIQQLIKPCFDFVEQVRNEQNRRIESSQLPVATTIGGESDAARIAIQGSAIKQHAEKLIDNARNFIMGNRSLGDAKARFFTQGGKTAIIYSPVVIACQSNESNDRSVAVYTSPILAGKSGVEKTIWEKASALDESGMNATEQGYINDYFNSFLTAYSDGSEERRRIVTLVRELYSRNIIKTFANN